MQQSFNHDFGQLDTSDQAAMMEAVNALATPELKTGLEFQRAGSDATVTPHTNYIWGEGPEVLPRSMGKTVAIPSENAAWNEATKVKQYVDQGPRYSVDIDHDVEDKRGRTFEEARRLKTTNAQRKSIRSKAKMQKQSRKSNRK